MHDGNSEENGENIMDGIRTLTMYLPQFHRTPENDAWWGEGFTEWTAVRAACPLYEGHVQPRKPMNGYYYNLLEKETMQKQVEWMKQYGIDGQCFYHYYFKDGRKILEKPAENLLEWSDVDMPFCFCWANTTWARTWSNIGGNTWADQFENDKKGSSEDGVLLSQKYGREKEWKQHFEYLLPFFRDKRYIKVGDRPVFLATWVDNIPCLQQMVEYWRTLADRAGIGNIFFIGMGANYAVPNMDALLIGGPHSFWNLGKPVDGIFRPEYDDIWEQTLAAEAIDGCKTYIGGSVDYDDTGRRGRHGGIVVNGFTIEKFYYGMKELYKRNIIEGNEFVFINAWNEWGEGMYLEPDERYGFEALRAVQRAKEDALLELKENKLFAKRKSADLEVGYHKKGYRKAIECFSDWMRLREKKIEVADYLVQNGVKNVAIYGYGQLGKHLVAELEHSNIKVAYIIDRNVRLNHLKYEIRQPDEDLPEVDAVIVTPVDEFENIYFALKDRMNSRFFSLLELTSELV